MSAPTLVVGATGTVGSAVVRELVERGVHVRAFVRDAQRGQDLLGPDIELAVGDLADPGTLRTALDGVDRVFLACGNVPGQVDLERGAIDAAADAGVSRLVKLSAAAAAPDSALLFPRWQAEIEAHLRASSVPWVLLRPSDYMTNVLAHADAVRRTGNLFAPLAGARTAMIDPRDVGAVAGAVLTSDGHDGMAYELTGPEAITYEQVAEALSAATGRAITFVPVPDEVARAAMLEQGLPEDVADFVVALSGALRDGLAAHTTDDVERLTGHQPRPFADFARDHAPAFAAV